MLPDGGADDVPRLGRAWGAAALSLVLHAAAFGAVTLLVTRALPLAPAEDGVAMIFADPDAASRPDGSGGDFDDVQAQAPAPRAAASPTSPAPTRDMDGQAPAEAERADMPAPAAPGLPARDPDRPTMAARDPDQPDMATPDVQPPPVVDAPAPVADAPAEPDASPAADLPLPPPPPPTPPPVAPPSRPPPPQPARSAAVGGGRRPAPHPSPRPVAPMTPPAPAPEPQPATSAGIPTSRTDGIASNVPHTTGLPAARGTATAEAIDAGWRGELAAWLAAHRIYPEDARRAGEQGRAVVRFTIDHDGRVLAVALVGSSGADRLDDAAQAMLRGKSVPPLPAAMPQDRLTVTVTIRYALTR